jgi:hypothetical protein
MQAFQLNRCVPWVPRALVVLVLNLNLVLLDYTILEWFVQLGALRYSVLHVGQHRCFSRGRGGLEGLRIWVLLISACRLWWDRGTLKALRERLILSDAERKRLFMRLLFWHQALLVQIAWTRRESEFTQILFVYHVCLLSICVAALLQVTVGHNFWR